MCASTYIRGIADELTKENLLVAIEGVDDEAQKLVDLRLESEGLGLYHQNVSHCRVAVKCELTTKHREQGRNLADESVILGIFL